MPVTSFGEVAQLLDQIDMLRAQLSQLGDVEHARIETLRQQVAEMSDGLLLGRAASAACSIGPSMRLVLALSVFAAALSLWERRLLCR